MRWKILIIACLSLAVRADRELFAKFQVDHNKFYETIEEHEHRYEIFKKNLQTVEEHNLKFKQGLVTWKLGINQFADLGSEEFKNYLGTWAIDHHTNKNRRIYKTPLDAMIPNSIDWREKGAVTPIKNQGGCGAGWAFSATGTLEGQYLTKKGKLISLSEQQLIDCANSQSGYPSNGCNGGIAQYSLNYVRDHGIESEVDYPYVGKGNGNCEANLSKIVVQTKGFTEIEQLHEGDLRSAVGLEGPVSVALNSELFHLYQSGIFANTSCSRNVNHALTAVGYGIENGTNYWIVKNSWGTGFGENGYIRLLMGHNICGIVNQACFPYF